MTKNSSATLLVHCPDRKGLVAGVTDFLKRHNGNIIYLDQLVQRKEKTFFLRLEWDLEGFSLPRQDIATVFEREIATPFNMHWNLYFSDERPRLAIMVSRFPHCLHDILGRWHSGEWNVDIPLIISNHPDLEPVARNYQVPFVHCPIDKDNKPQCERRQLDLLRVHQVDLVILARYMQILSPEFIALYPNRIINIHHSFLPAFPGAKPYHSAFKRGVKIIGATSHYVTSELDAGPIIEQDVVRLKHKYQLSDLIRHGRDLEKTVLSRAIWLHLQRKLLVFKNRTIVFP